MKGPDVRARRGVQMESSYFPESLPRKEDPLMTSRAMCHFDFQRRPLIRFMSVACIVMAAACLGVRPAGCAPAASADPDRWHVTLGEPSSDTLALNWKTVLPAAVEVLQQEHW